MLQVLEKDELIHNIYKDKRIECKPRTQHVNQKFQNNLILLTNNSLWIQEE